MVLIAEENYKSYGRCISFKTGNIKLLVTIDLGPRIIFYGKDDQNIMFEDLQDTTNKGGEFFDKNLKGEGIWHLYGGHRLWKSPEYMDTYYPDNKQVNVIKNGDEVTFTSVVETTTKLQKSMIIKMNDDGSVLLTQKIENKSNVKTTPISAWGLTVLDKGAKATIALPDDDTGFLPNRNVVFWSYTNIKDERINLNNNNLIIEQRNIVDPIKVGLFTQKQINVDIKGQIFSLQIDKKVGTYPDFNCNIECYTNNHIFEIETLSPLCELAPNECLIHNEYWTLK